MPVINIKAPHTGDGGGAPKEIIIPVRMMPKTTPAPSAATHVRRVSRCVTTRIMETSIENSIATTGMRWIVRFDTRWKQVVSRVATG